MSQYFEDVEKRIAYAKEFGAGDEGALRLIKEIQNEAGVDPARLSGEIYFQRVGDSQSQQVRRAAEMSESIQSLYGRVNAFQALKLTHAQVPNMGQGTINGSILAARITGNPVAGLRELLSIGRDLKRNPGKYQEVAERSAAALETTLMQTLGEYSAVNHRILGRELTGILSPLEIFNNPTKFLEVTGFIAAEKLQRTVAANMGFSLAERIMDDIAKARAKGKVPVHLQKQAEEMHLDWTKPANEADMLNAALRFSNAANFRNTPGYLPNLWNDPHWVWFRKFKTFAFNQGRFIFENVLKPAFDNELGIKNRIAPTMTVVGAAAALGVPIDTLRRLLSGDDKEYTMTQKWIRGFTAFGGLGIWMDMLSGGNPVMKMLGPVAGDVAKIVTEGRQLVEGKQGPAKTAVDTILGTITMPREKDIKEFLGVD
jgi:hypothetical protein